MPSGAEPAKRNWLVYLYISGACCVRRLIDITEYAKWIEAIYVSTLSPYPSPSLFPCAAARPKCRRARKLHRIACSAKYIRLGRSFLCTAVVLAATARSCVRAWPKDTTVRTTSLLSLLLRPPRRSCRLLLAREFAFSICIARAAGPACEFLRAKLSRGDVESAELEIRPFFSLPLSHSLSVHAVIKWFLLLDWFIHLESFISSARYIWR